jgi:hypothetical protein
MDINTFIGLPLGACTIKHYRPVMTPDEQIL